MQFNRFSLCGDCRRHPARCVRRATPQAQAPTALSGQVTSTQEAHDGRRPGQRQERGLDHHHHGGDQRQGPLQLPGRPPPAGQVHDLDPRRRLHARRSEVGRNPGRRQRQRRPQAQQAPATSHLQLSNGEWLASLPGTDQRQAVPDQLHRLPHAAAHLQRAARRRRVDPGVQPHGPLLRRARTPAQPQLLVSRRRRAASARASIPRSRKQAAQYPGRRQPDQSGRQGIRVQDAAAAEGPRHPRDHHRIRPAAQRTPIRTTWSIDADGNAWYSDFGSQFVGELDPKTGKVDRLSRFRSCARSSRRARSISSSIATAISGWR